jgi:hypothetical protein
MTAAYLILIASVVGQYPLPGYAGPYNSGYGYGYGYYPRTPLPSLDPVRYNRFYSGEGYYTYAPPPIENPEVMNLRHTVTPTTGTIATTGTTGRVLALNEAKKQITMQVPAGTLIVPYGPTTHFLAADGDLPTIKPGNLINVNQNTITILRRSQ